MAERVLLCKILSPERIVYTNEARMVVVPTPDGEIGVLPLHAPLVSTLGQGEVRVLYGDGKAVEVIAISGGYVQVHEDRVIVLADNAALLSNIDVERARRAAEEQRTLLEELPKEAEEERDRCERDLNWCEIQVKVAEKRK